MEKESHRISDEPQKIPFKLLAEITDGFSEKAKIGSGGFGQVYKGVLKDGTEIAVKKLHLVFDNKQFENELSHLKGLKHENIVQIVGFCDETEQEIRPYQGRLVVADIIHRLLCLEFVPNGNLGNILKENFSGHNWNVRFKIIKGICVGLKYLHDVDIMHFDLKPDNILLDEKMVPKIADFGISRIAAGEANTIATITVMGTPGFMPPEFITKQIISKHFDIFSLGVIIKRVVVSGLGDYMSIADMEDQACIEHVHDSWKKKLQETSGHASFEVDSKQVRTCIEIAVACMEADRYKRPTMQDIVCKLKEVETTMQDIVCKLKEVETTEVGDSKVPDRRDLSSLYGSSHSLLDALPNQLPLGFLEDITDGSHSLLDALPNQLPLGFLEDITDGFSPARQLGRGAFGAVYKGTLKDGTEIAVKKISNDSLVTPQKQLQNEVRNLTAVRHDNIVKLLGYCYETRKTVVEHNGRYVLVDTVSSLLCYEYMKMGSLDNHIFAPSTLDWATRLKIIKGKCQGLHFLHKGTDQPIVHMVLKPDNILLDENMAPKIADFGLSRLFGAEQTRMYTQNIVGALGYMAPEFLYRGEISTHLDIYSLGLLIIDITTGERNPQSKEDVSARKLVENVRQNWTVEEHIRSKYASLDDISLQQVKTCIEIGLQCVEMERKKRPPIDDIVAWLDGRPVGSKQ